MNLATQFEPGSNLRDSAAGASWSFLLPDLAVERLLCLGPPSEPSLATLARLGRSVVVWCPDGRQHRDLLAVVAGQGWSHVDIRWVLPPSPPWREDGFDLVCLPADAARSLAGVKGDWVRRVPTMLRPGGRVYFEPAGRPARRLGGALQDALARDGFGDAQRLWLTPRRGEVRAAAPASFPEVSRYLVAWGLHRPESSTGLVDRLGRVAGGAMVRRHPGHRPGVLVGPASEASRGEVPRYVSELARQAGVDLSSYRWGLSARGRYRSRKIVLFLFPYEGDAPEYVVKMTREPGLNHRLENEQSALCRLQREGIGTAGSYPQVEFFGHHGGLAVLAERALDGEPFERRTTGSGDCRYARAAVDWLIDLAGATVVRSPEPLADAGDGDGLGRLLETYERLYRPGADERAYLADHVARLAAAGSVPGRLPAVFQHGDPGTWNLLATPTGHVAFLDWEAAEQYGMPLWDLFHFFRSYGVLASRWAGTRRPLDGFARQFLADTPVARLLSDSLDHYTSRVSLAGDLVGPLFLTGWMHRALKEAARLRPDRLAGGHYAGLVRLCVSERQNPHLKWLLSP